MQNLLCHLCYLFSISSHQTDCFPNLPLQVAWCVVRCCALFAVCHPIAVSPSPEKASLEGREQLYFSSGGGCPSSQFCSILHSPALSLHITKMYILHCAPGSADRFLGRGSTPCRTVNWGKPTGHIYQDQILKQCSLEDQVSAEYKCALLVL